MEDVLTAARFRSLRGWAMNFAVPLVVGPGVAMWPIFRFERDQKQRLRAIARAVPTKIMLVWLALFTIVSFFLSFFIGFIPLLPLTAEPLPPSPGQVSATLLEIAISAEILASIVLGSLAGTWIAGRIIGSMLTSRPLRQDQQDADLLFAIERQIRRVVVLGAVAVTLPMFLVFVVGIG